MTPFQHSSKCSKPQKIVFVKQRELKWYKTMFSKDYKKEPDIVEYPENYELLVCSIGLAFEDNAGNRNYQIWMDPWTYTFIHYTREELEKNEISWYSKGVWLR